MKATSSILFSILLFLTSIVLAADPFTLIRRSDLKGLQTLLSQSPETYQKVNSNQETLLMEAAYNGDVPIIQFLTKKMDVNQKDKLGHTALFYAVSNSQEKAAMALIQLKADLQIKYDNAKDNILHAASRNGTLKIIDELISKAPELLNESNNLGETPLFEAVKSSQSKAARVLLKAGAKRDIKNKKNQALMDLIDPKMDKKMYRVLKTHDDL